MRAPENKFVVSNDIMTFILVNFKSVRINDCDDIISPQQPIITELSVPECEETSDIDVTKKLFENSDHISFEYCESKSNPKQLHLLMLCVSDDDIKVIGSKHM